MFKIPIAIFRLVYTSLNSAIAVYLRIERAIARLTT
uniref:Uncharacterized protein n=1 Tax=Myoviridae sp. ctLnO19 TaxID=2825085 RepID=A0A8S5P1C6_9CAUD|nr:MAG TPA: hypothetical protein [Myoviridae sp. ctLnO19]